MFGEGTGPALAKRKRPRTSAEMDSCWRNFDDGPIARSSEEGDFQTLLESASRRTRLDASAWRQRRDDSSVNALPCFADRSCRRAHRRVSRDYRRRRLVQLAARSYGQCEPNSLTGGVAAQVAAFGRQR